MSDGVRNLELFTTIGPSTCIRHDIGARRTAPQPSVLLRDSAQSVRDRSSSGEDAKANNVQALPGRLCHLQNGR